MTAAGPRPRPATGSATSPVRPDGTLKVQGEFAYSSDLWLDETLFGVTLRSPHPRARITGIDISAALAVPGVHAVLTHADVPGAKHYGLDESDQPVLAIDEVRYQGEPVAILAASDPHTARRALSRINGVLCGAAAADRRPRGRLRLHAGPRAPGRQRGPPPADPLRVDPRSATADVVVVNEYEVGMQDQAFLGPESGLAVPAADGGVDLYVATQWLHVDQSQIAPCLGLPEDKVRLTLAGVGGAFGAREDLSMQVHACLLALHTGRPVRMVYGREESFFGHVHRHPAWMRYEHGANRDGKLVYVKATIVLDGGAYASTTRAVVGNAASLGVGPYEVPHVAIDAYGARTNNPPCGAMRGFGAVQACYAYESQMDAVAAALGLDPVEFRARNAVSQGSTLPTGQVIDSPAPLARDAAPARRACRCLRPLWIVLPGGYGNTTHGEGVRRGVGYGVGIKNICFSEGFDDYSTAAVRLEVVGGEAGRHGAHRRGRGRAGPDHAAGPDRALRARRRAGDRGPADTSIGSAGSSSASRQSYMSGGAVRAACLLVRDRLLGTRERRRGLSTVDLAGRPR